MARAKAWNSVACGRRRGVSRNEPTGKFSSPDPLPDGVATGRSASRSARVIIVILGVHFVGFLRIGWLSREARFHVARKPAGILGAYVVGLAFAFGWTPCVGPVLAAILFVAGAEGTAIKGATLLAAYSGGIGVPFLLAALFSGRFIVWASRFSKQMQRVQMTMGGVLIVTGVMFMTGQMATISNWLLEMFPVFAKIG